MGLPVLPKEDWDLRLVAGGRVVAGIYEDPAGYVRYAMIDLSDLPNDLIGLDDLKRFGIEPIKGPAIGQAG